jgi:uncharacterized RDD family membrane protein YckC
MKPAGFFKRIFSLMYDTLAVLGIIFSFTLVLVLINGEISSENTINSFLQRAILILSGPLFYCYFWLKSEGQTLGMQAWKIRLVSEDGSDLSWSICIKRCVISFLTILPLGVGFAYMFFDKENRSLSDIYTGTRVVDIKNQI